MFLTSWILGESGKQLSLSDEQWVISNGCSVPVDEWMAMDRGYRDKHHSPRESQMPSNGRPSQLNTIVAPSFNYLTQATVHQAGWLQKEQDKKPRYWEKELRLQKNEILKQ